jgi:flagellar hook assembly protein FlgD
MHNQAGIRRRDLLAGGATIAVAASLALAGGPSAVAGVVGPTLTITPNELFYPCDGTQPVTFSVAGFGDNTTVVLHVKTATGKKIGSITTGNTGSGDHVFNFNTSKIPPGNYTFFAVQDHTADASAVFTEGECP